ncbi:MAG: spore coat protein, partial [Candidatus Hydrogenedentes bacterium]|nr:spore coat protein [Candidatus Hydrogenedentota bacterium]
MVYYPIQTLVDAGITDVMLVTGGNNAGDFLRLIGNGKEFNLSRISYAYQEGEGGIAAALALAEDFAENTPIVVILGDNILEKDIGDAVREFERQKDGARILLKEVPDPQRFGVPLIEGEKIVRIEEKPEKPASQFAVIGVYMYDKQVFNTVKTLKPSARGELEITDVNNAYIEKGKMKYSVVDGWWADAGTSFEALLRANRLVAEKCHRSKEQNPAS